MNSIKKWYFLTNVFQQILKSVVYFHKIVQWIPEFIFLYHKLIYHTY